MSTGIFHIVELRKMRVLTYTRQHTPQNRQAIKTTATQNDQELAKKRAKGLRWAG